MTDLAGFLLARIAEDEAVARADVERLRNAPRRGGKTTTVRRWAECEAKRRIVEHCKGMMTESDEWDEPTQRTDAVFTLRLLAMPYIDHADYLDEWRP